MPNSFFEVEHGTDMKNSLLKFNDLQDFSSRMVIVSETNRCGEFASRIDPSSRMRTLTILTNSNDIAKSLSDLDVRVNVMMLGGRLRKETQAFVTLAKSCLEAWNVYLDISMVSSRASVAFNLIEPP